MAISRRLWAALALAILVLSAFSPPAQVPIIEITAEAGFDGHFRDGDWLPVHIRVTNAGDGVRGQLVVRPETSGAGISNTYSTPVELPSGAAQRVTLYITASGFATQVRVEMIDETGAVLASAPASVRAVQPLDRVYAVVSESAAGVVDLTGARLGANAAFQSTETVDTLPALAAGYQPVDLLLFSDVDTSGLSSDQRSAIAGWVAEGGHLVVTGGSNWEATAAGLMDLLPLRPSGSTTVDDLAPLAAWLRDDVALAAQTIIATGEVQDGARVLVAGESPLLVRRAYGAGTVDYLAADPNAAPLRGWPALGEFWQALVTTVDVKPGWTLGTSDWDLATQAVEILPGYNLLPNVLPLCGFLALYIALIGPVNYFVLARLNRRELAWVTIPLLIILFSVLSYVLGFNLRGTEVTLSRLSVVRVWPDVDQSPVDGLVGLLSPRRAQYDLALTDGGTLRPIPRNVQGGILTGNVQSSINVRQTTTFSADDFAVDASFIAGFDLSAWVDAPAIGGSASLSRDLDTGQMQVRGLVRNDSDITLSSPVIVARGESVTLEEPLGPGATAAFDFLLPDETVSSPLFQAPGGAGVGTGRAFSTINSPLNGQTVNDLLGTMPLRPGARRTVEDEEQRRRRLFLASLVNDYALNNQHRAMGRGDHVYLAGWTAAAPLDLVLDGAPWNSSDTSVYIIELAVDVVQPIGSVTISPDQFTWIGETPTVFGDRPPYNMSLQPGDEAAFRFTPLPSAVLGEVDALTLRLERTSIGIQSIPVELWDWEADAWDVVEAGQGATRIDQPARFLGPENAVRVRLSSELVGGFLRVDELLLEQHGTF